VSGLVDICDEMNEKNEVASTEYRHQQSRSPTKYDDDGHWKLSYRSGESQVERIMGMGWQAGRCVMAPLSSLHRVRIAWHSCNIILRRPSIEILLARTISSQVTFPKSNWIQWIFLVQ